MYHALVGFATVRNYLKDYEDKLGEATVEEITENIARNCVAWDTSKDKREGLLPEVAVFNNPNLYKKITGKKYSPHQCKISNNVLHYHIFYVGRKRYKFISNKFLMNLYLFLYKYKYLERNRFLMKNKNSKLAIGIAVLFEIILITTSMLSIASRQWKNLTLSLLAIVCIILPFIITRIANIKNIVLLSSFQLISLLFILLAQYFGQIKKFYLIFSWWDLLLHAIFGGYAVLIALHLIQGIIIKEKEVTKERFTIFTVIFAFSFSIALGTLWEMFEFVGDYLFKTTMVKGGLEDIASDLLIKILSAFITSIICYYRKLRNQK